MASDETSKQRMPWEPVPPWEVPHTNAEVDKLLARLKVAHEKVEAAQEARVSSQTSFAPDTRDALGCVVNIENLIRELDPGLLPDRCSGGPAMASH